MAFGRWFLTAGLSAGLVATPALAIKVIGDAGGLAEVPAVQAVSRAVEAPVKTNGRGLSGAETAVMLLGSLVFSAVLLSRRPD